MTLIEIKAEAARIAAADTHSETEAKASILRLIEAVQAECDGFVHVEAAKWQDSIALHAALAIVEAQRDEALTLLREARQRLDGDIEEREWDERRRALLAGLRR